MPLPLAHPFLQLLRAARAARSGGPDAWERLQLHQAARRAPSRRSFVAGLGALAACGTGDDGKRDSGGGDTGNGGTGSGGTGSGGTVPVVILGAGLAGLACCHRLAQQGRHAQVFEARDRVGGRVVTGRGLVPAVPGLTLELGAEWINTADEALMTLVAELGLELRDSWEEFDLATMVWLDGRRVQVRTMMDDLDRLAVACDEALAAIPDGGAHISYQTPEGAEALDQTSAGAWLAGLGLGDDARRWAEIVTLADYGLELDEQSALNVISFFTSTGEELYDERWLTAGGNDQIATLLGERYADRIELGAELVGIEAESDGTWTLRFGGGRAPVRAQAVVCTLPFTVLRELDLDGAGITGVKRTCIDTLGYGTNAKLGLPFARRFWRDVGDSGLVYTDLFQEGWDAAMMQGLVGGGFASFVGGRAGAAVGTGTAAERGAELLAHLETLWPGCGKHLAGEAWRADWPGDPWVRGSYSCYKVGQWTSIGGAEPEAVGSLFFAGEHTSYAFQGYMNGAAQSGMDVAGDVLAWLSGAPSRSRRARAGRRRLAPPR